MNSSTTPKNYLNILKYSALTTALLLASNQQALATCTYTVTNNWGGGFTGEIKVTNDTAATVNNWSVSWQEANASVTNAWNATLSGSNPYSVTALSWNATLASGASATFGFQANGTAGAPKVSGSLCGAATSSAAATSTATTSKSSASAQLPVQVVKAV